MEQVNRPLAYVCSPYAGDIENNVKQARHYCLWLLEEGYTPVCPHIYYTQFLDDNNPDGRELGLQLGLEALDKCPFMFVFLNEERRISDGMLREIQYAQERCNIKVVTYQEVAKKLLNSSITG